MRSYRRISPKVAGVAAAVLVASSATVAVAAGGGGNPNGGASGGKQAHVAGAPTYPAGSQLQFVAVAPCRMLDTRLAGGRLNNSQRNFQAVGNLSGQGGKSSGCGVPSYAVALSLNLVAIGQSGSGNYMTAWPAGTAQPLASSINYPRSGDPIANALTLPITAGGGWAFSLKTPGKAQVVADVTGYYVKPMYAVLTPSGTFYGGSSGVVSASRVSTGRYQIEFDRNVRNCAATTSDLIFASTRDVSADMTFSADPTTVTVQVTNKDGSAEDTYFSIAMTC